MKYRYKRKRDGGFVRGLKDYGLFMADSPLSVLGMGDLIDNEEYENTKLGETLSKINKISSPILATGSQMAMNSVMPGSGTAVQGLTRTINSQAEPQDTNLGIEQSFANMAGPLASMGLSMLEYGGYTKRPYLAEGGEVVDGGIPKDLNRQGMNINSSSSVTLQGDSHNNRSGGQLLSGGERVFSDKLKASTGKTFAEEADILTKRIGRYEKQAEKGDNLTKKTAKLMVNKAQSLLDSLFNEQESMKTAKMAKGIKNLEMKYGGSVKDLLFGEDLIPVGLRKYEEGGDTYDFMSEVLSDQVPMAGPTEGTQMTTPNNIGFGFEGQEDPFFDPFAGEDFSGYNPRKPIPYGKYANMLGTAAPTLYNLGMGAFARPEQIDPERYTLKRTVPYRDVDFTPIEQAINTEARIQRRNNANYGASSGQVVARNLQTSANTAKARANAIMQAQQFNNQNRFSVDQANNQTDMFNSQTRFNADNLNAQNRAKKSEYLAKGLEGVSGLTQQNTRYGNQAKRDKQLELILRSLYGDYGFGNILGE